MISRKLGLFFSISIWRELIFFTLVYNFVAHYLNHGEEYHKDSPSLSNEDKHNDGDSGSDNDDDDDDNNDDDYDDSEDIIDQKCSHHYVRVFSILI